MPQRKFKKSDKNYDSNQIQNSIEPSRNNRRIDRKRKEEKIKKKHDAIQDDFLRIINLRRSQEQRSHNLCDMFSEDEGDVGDVESCGDSSSSILSKDNCKSSAPDNFSSTNFSTGYFNSTVERLNQNIQKMVDKMEELSIISIGEIQNNKEGRRCYFDAESLSEICLSTGSSDSSENSNSANSSIDQSAMLEISGNQARRELENEKNSIETSCNNRQIIKISKKEKMKVKKERMQAYIQSIMESQKSQVQGRPQERGWKMVSEDKGAEGDVESCGDSSSSILSKDNSKSSAPDNFSSTNISTRFIISLKERLNQNIQKMVDKMEELSIISIGEIQNNKEGRRCYFDAESLREIYLSIGSSDSSENSNSANSLIDQSPMPEITGNRVRRKLEKEKNYTKLHPYTTNSNIFSCCSSIKKNEDCRVKKYVFSKSLKSRGSLGGRMIKLDRKASTSSSTSDTTSSSSTSETNEIQEEILADNTEIPEEIVTVKSTSDRNSIEEVDDISIAKNSESQSTIQTDRSIKESIKTVSDSVSSAYSVQSEIKSDKSISASVKSTKDISTEPNSNLPGSKSTSSVKSVATDLSQKSISEEAVTVTSDNKKSTTDRNQSYSPNTFEEVVEVSMKEKEDFLRNISDFSNDVNYVSDVNSAISKLVSDKKMEEIDTIKSVKQLKFGEINEEYSASDRDASELVVGVVSDDKMMDQPTESVGSKSEKYHGLKLTDETNLNKNNNELKELEKKDEKEDEEEFDDNILYSARTIHSEIPANCILDETNHLLTTVLLDVTNLITSVPPIAVVEDKIDEEEEYILQTSNDKMAD